ncbi:MAG: amino acid ABC transporter permease [Acutalibacteraceae bacterium]|nr:amino acid ABC transporter permease [Acutalibacteraceae bacterium]
MFEQVISELSNGFVVTIELFLLTLAISLPLGLIISFGSMSKFKPLKVIVKLFVWVIRGTPLMLQLIIFFYGPGLIANWATSTGSTNAIMVWLSSFTVLDRFLAATIMFSVNYACYFSEIFRGGIEAIPRGQYEAGQVLGMTKTQVFFKVVLLQVIKNILPPISNEVITLVKDTSLARVISVYELIWAGEAFIKSKGIVWPLLLTGVFYLAFNGIVTFVFGKLEKKLSYFKN